MPRTISTCCCICHLPKEGNENKFYTCKQHRDGLNSRCKKCSAEYQNTRRQRPEVIKKMREYEREYQKEYGKRPKTMERKRESNYLRKYGLTLDQYNQLLDAQDNKCVICGIEDPGGKGRFHVDHCHATGQIRGLLCHNCNLMLGHSRDNVETLRSAARYLER